MTTILSKQLLINCLLEDKGCFDLRDEVKGYLFIDEVHRTSIQRKNRLIQGIKCFIHRWQDPEDLGHWATTYLYQINVQCISCLECGGYSFINNPELYINIARRALCNCAGFDQYYQENISIIVQPLEIYT